MRLLAINFIIALIWCAITGLLSLLNLILGLVLSAMVLWLIREQIGSLVYLKKVFQTFVLFVLFFKELFFSAFRVAVLVLSPKMNLKPGIIAYPLSLREDFQITLLANMITLTPGTLSVDVSLDKLNLFVHIIDCSEPEKIKQEIADGFERKIMEIFS